MPEDGVDRWLIAGELRQGSSTKRNRFHSRIMVCTATELEIWCRSLPRPRGQMLAGEVGIRLRRNPDTTVKVDVAYVSHEVLTRQTDEVTIIDGVPTLAVEILSPNDVIDDIAEKIQAYQDAGVPLVWIVDPYFRTVTVHRLGAEPQLFNVDQELSCEPLLPGFRCPVAKLFD